MHKHTVINVQLNCNSTDYNAIKTYTLCKTNLGLGLFIYNETREDTKSYENEIRGNRSIRIVPFWILLKVLDSFSSPLCNSLSAGDSAMADERREKAKQGNGT